MATTIIDRLVTKVEFDSDTSGLKSATRSIGAFKTNIVAVLGPVVALFSGGLFINSIANAADEMIKFADATGVAVEDLQDLEFAVQRQGGSVAGLRSSITNLSKALGELSLDKGLAKDVFEALGLSAFDADGKVKSSTESLLELNVAFQTLSKSEQVGFGKKLGLDIGTIQLLQTAPRELQELIAQSKEFGRITEVEARQAAKFNDELTNLNTVVSRIAQSIGLSILPALTEFLVSLGDVVSFIRDNSGFFEILTDIVLVLGTAFVVLNTSLLSFIATFLGASVAFLASPLFLIPAALIAITVGLALLIDDFLAWREGADSAFGGFFDFVEGKIDEGIQNWRAFGQAVTSIIDSIVAIWDNFIDRFTSGIDKISNFTSGVGDFFGDAFTTVPGASLTLGRTGIRENIRSTVIGDVNVIVNAPGADSREIAANVSATLTEQLRAAAEDNDSSIAR